MMDLITGEMIPISKKILDEIPVMPQTDLMKVFNIIAKSQELNQKIQQLKDATIPNRSRQGPVFAVGEFLMIKDAMFRVVAITKKGLVIQGVPKQ